MYVCKGARHASVTCTSEKRPARLFESAFIGGSNSSIKTKSPYASVLIWNLRNQD